MAISIEKMTVKHLGEIDLLEKASFSNPTSLELLKRELRLPMANLKVAIENQKVCGYLNFWFLDDEIHIMNLVVDPGKRRQGIATQLFNQMMEFTKEVRVYHLELRSSNHPAQRFYEKYGFQVCGRRVKYYGDNGEDALLMSWKRSTPSD